MYEIEAYFEAILAQLGEHYQTMNSRIDCPVFTNAPGLKCFRHKILSGDLVCFLKGVKIVSTLNAATMLLRFGFVQEIGALCRMVDDYCNEIYFLLQPQDGREFSKDQIQFVKDFFQEEFDNPSNLLLSSQKRTTVPAKKIHATFANLVKSFVNPYDAQEMIRKKHRAFSGYVHGAYPQIMEMYGGQPSRFYLSGMLGTPRIDEWRNYIIGEIYSAIIVSMFVAKKIGAEDISEAIKSLLLKYEDDTGCKSEESPENILIRIKTKK